MAVLTAPSRESQLHAGNFRHAVQGVHQTQHATIEIVVVGGPLTQRQYESAENTQSQGQYHHLNYIPVLKGVSEERTTYHDGDIAPEIAQADTDNAIFWRFAEAAEIAHHHDTDGEGADHDRK